MARASVTWGALAVAAAAGLLGGCSTERVEVPAPGGTAEEVLTAYFKALDVQDCEAAHAMETGPLTTDSWCDEVRTQLVEIGGQVTDTRALPGIVIAAQVDTMSGSDRVSNGRHTLFATMRQSGPQGQWRVAGLSTTP